MNAYLLSLGSTIRGSAIPAAYIRGISEVSKGGHMRMQKESGEYMRVGDE